jgi:hypothetical protein
VLSLAVSMAGEDDAVSALDTSSGAAFVLVRTLNALLNLSANRLLCLASSAMPTGLEAACCCSWPASVASCLKVATRSWTGAWRIAKMRWTREWWA